MCRRSYHYKALNASDVIRANDQVEVVEGDPVMLLNREDSCAFYKDMALYKSFGGIVLEADEGEVIAKALRDKKAAILVNYGLLTYRKSVKSTIFCLISLKMCCCV
ncbi:Uncharacterized protein HZ326_29322 [Fusarium oxysporum f. sp. albedinis]|nr:Uncharacterized protein HZ326_29322 [Fusarium oxysporum f. sp. albedinis]